MPSCRFRRLTAKSDIVSGRRQRPRLIQENEMEAKLYVGSLSYSTTETDLEALFAPAGTVKSVAIIKDRDSGRSKGFAFVEMSSQEEAQQAISLLDGKEFQDRMLKINMARPREEGGR